MKTQLLANIWKMALALFGPLWLCPWTSSSKIDSIHPATGRLFNLFINLFFLSNRQIADKNCCIQWNNLAMTNNFHLKLRQLPIQKLKNLSMWWVRQTHIKKKFFSSPDARTKLNLWKEWLKKQNNKALKIQEMINQTDVLNSDAKVGGRLSDYKGVTAQRQWSILEQI